MSRDLTAAVSFVAGVGALTLASGRLVGTARSGISDAVSRATTPLTFAVPDAIASLDGAVWAIAASVLPIAGCALAAGVLAAVLQTGAAASADGLTPKPDRLDPIAGLKRLCARRTVVEIVKTWSKLLLVAAAVGSAIHSHRMAIAGWLDSSPESAVALVLTIAWSAALRSAVLLLGVGAVDVLLQRHLHERDLRMTKDEVRRDHKEEEGDPHVKGARRQAHREIANERMVAAARTATFVAVNPTHVATAVLYDDSKDDAPRVVAKGAGELARRIRRAADDSGVRVVHDRPLARALFRVPLDGEIPEALYTAVAEVLAYLREVDDGA